MTADEVLNRAESRRNAVDHASLDVVSARLDLALLLRVEETALGYLDTEFPEYIEVLDEDRTRQLVAAAFSRRLDLQGENRRIDSARQRAKATRRQVDSSLVLQAGQDRILLNWSKPLGENRDAGAREQALADIGLASVEAEDARRKIEVDIRMAQKKLASLATTLPRARLVADRVAERLTLTRQLVDQGRQPATSLMDVADQLGNARSQLIDLELARAQNLADLRLASASIPELSSDPATLVATFTRLP
jgi:outer membrane protein TolC